MSSGEFEDALNDTYKLTIFFQNKEKLNGEHGPLMRKLIYDGLSCGTMKVVNTDDWSSKKTMTHPTRSVNNTKIFSTAGRTWFDKSTSQDREDGFLEIP